jgi:hypothetical protein
MTIKGAAGKQVDDLIGFVTKILSAFLYIYVHVPIAGHR